MQNIQDTNDCQQLAQYMAAESYSVASYAENEWGMTPCAESIFPFDVALAA